MIRAPPEEFNQLDAFIGEQVRLHRQRAGWSQKRLGELIGVSFQQVQKYETGRNRISAARLFVIADRFNVSVTVFFPEAS